MLDIEVVYATTTQQVIIALQVPEGITIAQAIITSELLPRFPELQLAPLNVGIFASICKLSQPLKQGDRVEIYRPLLYDPKEARRQRAKKG